jgi:hypothetical protein
MELKLLAKGILIVCGLLACTAVLPILGRLFTTPQLANSVLPLLIMLVAAFVTSLLVSVVKPNSVKINAAWVALGATGFLAGDVYVIMRDPNNHNLWPIEIVMLVGMATCSLTAGAVIGQMWSRAARTSP